MAGAVLLAAGMSGRLDGAITLTPPTLPNAKVAIPYRYALPFAGNLGALRCSMLGSTWPSGLIVTQSCVLEGTITTAGSFTFRVNVSDSNASENTTEFSLSLIVETPFDITVPAKDGVAGVAYSNQVAVSGGIAPYIYEKM